MRVRGCSAFRPVHLLVVARFAFVSPPVSPYRFTGVVRREGERRASLLPIVAGGGRGARTRREEKQFPFFEGPDLRSVRLPAVDLNVLCDARSARIPLHFLTNRHRRLIRSKCRPVSPRGCLEARLAPPARRQRVTWNLTAPLPSARSRGAGSVGEDRRWREGGWVFSHRVSRPATLDA